MSRDVRSTIAFILCACGAATAQTWSDDFNRPDGAIGGDWTPVSGAWAVASNRGRHTAATVHTILKHNTASAPYVNTVCTLDVFAPGTTSQLSGLLIGLDGTDSIMVKIQDQVTTTAGFSHIGIYHRTSPTTWAAWVGTGTGFAALTAPFTEARVKVTFSDADTIVVEIDTDFNGTPEQTYTKTGVLSIAPNFGQAFGITGWGTTAEFDNFSVTLPTTGCYANCDASTAEPVLNVADFTCFLTKFAGGDPYANCDASTSEPTLNVADFTCFLTKFATGCP